MPRNLPILPRRLRQGAGPVRGGGGVLINGDWEVISRFVKFVNDGRAEDPVLKT